MTHADGIDPEVFQILEAASPHFGRHGGSQRSRIVMQTDAFDFHPSAIECESLVGIEFQCAQSDAGAASVDAFAAVEQVDLQRV